MGFQCGVQLLGQCRAAWQDSPSWITRSSLAGTFFGQTGEWNRIRAPWAPSWQFPPPHPPRFGQRPKLILSFFCLLPSNDAPMLSKQSFELYDKTWGPCFPPVSAPATNLHTLNSWQLDPLAVPRLCMPTEAPLTHTQLSSPPTGGLHSNPWATILSLFLPTFLWVSWEGYRRVGESIDRWRQNSLNDSWQLIAITNCTYINYMSW